MGVAADFKKFLISGSLISMAVAFVVGLAVVALIGALVTDIIDPLIGAAGHVNFASLGVFTINGSSILGGTFLGAIINFRILDGCRVLPHRLPLPAGREAQGGSNRRNPDDPGMPRLLQPDTTQGDPLRVLHVDGHAGGDGVRDAAVAKSGSGLRPPGTRAREAGEASQRPHGRAPPA